MKKIFLYETERGLLFFLLLNNFFKDEYFFIIEKNKKNNNIKLNNKIFKNIIIFNNKNLFYDRTIGILFFRKKYKELLQKIENNSVILFGLDHIFLGSNVFYKEKIYLLEDGMMNYSFYNSPLLKNWKTKIKKSISNFINLIFNLKVRIPYGISETVKKIYLTGLAPIPEEIKDKVEIINLKELWNKKSDDEKEEILNIFGFDKSIVNSIKNRKYILYTQPLSEDEVLLENEKIELYSKILKKYDKNCIVLKKHPREKTDYKKIFPDIEVMDQVFPAELLTLLDIHFEKAITIFSTAALTDSKVKVDFYGTEIHPKLLKKFGSQDTIMKRNAFFLDEEEKK